MQRTTHGFLAAVLCALVALSGCSMRMSRVRRTLNSYESALRLTVAPESSSPRIGQVLGLRFRLSNTSAAPIQWACLGVSRSFNFMVVPLTPREGRQPIAGGGATVDHPYCKSQLALGPHEEMEWREDVPVADIGVGEADLSVAVQVVYGRDCDEYACYDTMLSAAPLRLTLQREP
jgi:hypothetical protein